MCAKKKTAKSVCSLCSRPLQNLPPELIFLFLCRHVVHASCVSENLPLPPDPILRHLELGSSAARGISGSIALYVLLSLWVVSPVFLNFLLRFTSESMIKARLSQGCPVCHSNGEGRRVL